MKLLQDLARSSSGFRFVLTVICMIAVSGFAFGQHYDQHNLVSDIAGMADHTDPNLVNPWGLARSSSGVWWVSDNGTGVSTLYDGTGAPNALVVTIPGNSGPGKPTGAVFNGSSSFEVVPGSPAIFNFVAEDGIISGWNPGVDLTNAKIKVNQPHSIFKGSTIADMLNKPFLYVADFHNNRVAVFNSNFQTVNLGATAFVDDTLPAGFAPFNVQNIGGNLYVTFAKQDEDAADNVKGPGLGYVDVFSPSGALLQRLQHGNWLNAPWGVALAPSDFGKFSHAILVGQFGSGEIAAYNAVTGAFMGRVLDPGGSPIKIDGLWALSFGNAAKAGPYNSMFFTAGIEDEAHGLFGSLTAVASEQTKGNGQ